MPHDRFTKAKTVEIIAADLFCGAGGSSTGLTEAVNELGYKLKLTAVNHWDIAIATHTENHKEATHLCQSIDTIQPDQVIPGKRLQILLASPECTHHSNARGGKPRSDQKRADAWLLMRWLEKLYVENLIIENVKEFVDWGPLNAKGLPDKRHKGKYFNQFLDALRINYRVEWRILNCADYGDATTRERFFLIARRNGKKITFPEPTHASRKEIEKAQTQPNLFSDKTKLQTWRPAREIIDWDLKGESIFNRKKALSENTMRRIFAGLFKYSLKPFVMGTGGPTGQMRPRSVDEPLRTILTDPRQNLFIPYLVNMKGKDRRMREIDEPTFTQTTANNQYLAEPYLVNLSHTQNKDASMCKDLENPLNTICGKAMLALIEPFLVKYYGGHDAESVDNPIPTITANYEHYGLAEPFLVSYHSGQKDGGVNRSYSAQEPVPTLDTSNRYAVAEPFIVPCNHGKGDERFHSVNDPMKTITQVDAWGFVEPFLVKFKNNQDGQSIDDPLQTLTTKDCFGLCIPQLGAVIDIRFRMLQPHELSAAMGFPKHYVFTGTRESKVKQIGNAVPVNTAKALCKAVLAGK